MFFGKPNFGLPFLRLAFGFLPLLLLLLALLFLLSLFSLIVMLLLLSLLVCVFFFVVTIYDIITVTINMTMCCTNIVIIGAILINTNIVTFIVISIITIEFDTIVSINNFIDIIIINVPIINFCMYYYYYQCYYQYYQ